MTVIAKCNWLYMLHCIIVSYGNNYCYGNNVSTTLMLQATAQQPPAALAGTQGVDDDRRSPVRAAGRHQRLRVDQQPVRTLSMNANIDPDRRAHRWFWALLGLAVAAMAGLYTALGARPSPATGLAVAGASVLLLAATTQAARIRNALEMRSRPPSGPGRRRMPGTRLAGGPRADRGTHRPAGRGYRHLRGTDGRRADRTSVGGAGCPPAPHHRHTGGSHPQDGRRQGTPVPIYPSRREAGGKAP